MLAPGPVPWDSIPMEWEFPGMLEELSTAVFAPQMKTFSLLPLRCTRAEPAWGLWAPPSLWLPAEDREEEFWRIGVIFAEGGPCSRVEVG